MSLRPAISFLGTFWVKPPVEMMTTGFPSEMMRPSIHLPSLSWIAVPSKPWEMSNDGSTMLRATISGGWRLPKSLSVGLSSGSSFGIPAS